MTTININFNNSIRYPWAQFSKTFRMTEWIRNTVFVSAVYKKRILVLKISTVLEQKGGQKYSHQMGPESREALPSYI